MTTAERIAEQFDNNGFRMQLDDGQWLDDVCIVQGACEERAERRYSESTETWEAVPSYDRTTNTFYRYEFPDGSAIVVGYDCWDIEGEKPFSFAGE